MNTQMRRADRAVTDLDRIFSIIKSAKVLHLGLMDGDFPYVVPLHFGFQYEVTKDTFTFYMHSAAQGKKLTLIQKNPKACVELETDVFLLSGDDDPCTYGAAFSSFMGWGQASIVADAAEKKLALQLLMEHQTGRTFDFTQNMIDFVAIIKVVVTDYSAKARDRL